MSQLIGIDCEMVQGTGGENILARVTLVDNHGRSIYDTFVKPKKLQEVANYRYDITGITSADLSRGKDFYQVQLEVKNLISGKILVGHSVDNDLDVLELMHPTTKIKDIAKLDKFTDNRNQPQSLKDLADQYLGIKIQKGKHDPEEDAKAAMQLYTKYYT